MLFLRFFEINSLRRSMDPLSPGARVGFSALNGALCTEQTTQHSSECNIVKKKHSKISKNCHNGQASHKTHFTHLFLPHSSSQAELFKAHCKLGIKWKAVTWDRGEGLLVLLHFSLSYQHRLHPVGVIPWDLDWASREPSKAASTVCPARQLPGASQASCELLLTARKTAYYIQHS